MAYSQQRVTDVRKWSDKLFSFRTTRPEDFQFENGEFVTIGLRPQGKLIARAYSIVSTNDADHLEFLSIHVPDGPLTSHLSHIKAGDDIWVNNKSTGSLTLRYVQPGRNLYMLATGTGLAPFMCLIRSPQTYATFEHVVLVHTVRAASDLVYREEIESLANDRLLYVPTVTREPFAINQRGSELFKSGELFNLCQLPEADSQQDRVMLCGNPDMNREMTQYLKDQGWTITNHKGIGNFTVEKAFVLHHS